MQRLIRSKAAENGSVHTHVHDGDGDELDLNSLIPDRKLESSIPGYNNYSNGDVYAESPGQYEQEWEIDTLNAEMPYLQHVKSLSAAWPHLRYLAQWMEVTTSPNKWQLIRKLSPQTRRDILKERAGRTKIAAIDFISGQPVSSSSIKYINDPRSLACTLDEPAVPGASRLYVVEDLSRDVIEYLGSKLDIDPLFFREHLNDFTWYNTRDPWVELPDLDIVSRDRPYFRLTYMQPRYFETAESFKKAERQAGKFNVLRRLDADDGHESPFDDKSATVALVRSKASLWIRPAKANQQAIGVLLIDPPITEGHPLWKGHRPFKNSPTPQNQTPQYSLPPKPNLFEDLIFWIQQTSQQDIDAVENNPRAMAFRILEIICAEWLTLNQYITARLGQIEWAIESPKWFSTEKQESKGDSISFNTSLTKLHTWRRRLPIFKAMVADIRTKLFPDPNPNPSSSRLDCIDNLRKDFSIVAENMEDLLSRTERIAAVATAVAAIEESRRAIEQNKTLGRLTYLAVIFAPLSFVSSFFSMSTNVSELTGTIWIYFCVAIPVSLLVYLVVDKNWTNSLQGVYGLGAAAKEKIKKPESKR